MKTAHKNYINKLVIKYSKEELYKQIDRSIEQSNNKIQIATLELKQKYKELPRINMCESPIEVMFLEAFHTLFKETMVCIPQFIVGNRRADFAIIKMSIPEYDVVENIDISALGNSDILLVELDGARFHNERMDAIKNKYYEKNSYKYIRFTGKEVYHNAYNCAQQAMGAFNKIQDEIGELRRAIHDAEQE
jgi:hypothetical protein